MGTENPQISVLIATRNRAQSLERALTSLLRALHGCPLSTEVIIVDNGSSDATPRVIEGFYRACGVAGVPLLVPERGKARALNAGLARARGAVVAFTDDDVEIPEQWLVAAARFSKEYPEYAAATGPVCLPPGEYDRETLARVRLLRTLPLLDLGSAACETKHLYGCNMLVRRAALLRAGGFDERLGPGASGLHEDGELARRLRASGERILYFPPLRMFHTVDPARLTWEFFRELHRADGRSRFVRDGNRGLTHAARRWLGAALVWGWWAVCGQRGRRVRAWGRLVSHSEYLRLCWSAAQAAEQGPE